jgi:hypothetical protein
VEILADEGFEDQQRQRALQQISPVSRHRSLQAMSVLTIRDEA